MKSFSSSSIFILLMAVTCMGGNEPTTTVVVHQNGRKEIINATKATIAQWCVEFLKTANFNTPHETNPPAKTLHEIANHYRDTVAADYVVATYDPPITVHTVGGDVTAIEIIAGLNRPDQFASALFTIDPQGRLVEHGMYFGIVPTELRKAPTSQAAP
jgi:hypothetical protein